MTEEMANSLGAERDFLASLKETIDEKIEEIDELIAEAEEDGYDDDSSEEVEALEKKLAASERALASMTQAWREASAGR